MFIVQPFQKESSIRSVLGFMSLATRWGDYLYPGITVLTRDLHEIKAMHQIAISMRTWESPAQRKEFQKPETDLKISRHLSKILARQGIRKHPNKLRQKMSYWQRYGSLFEHFGLLQERRVRTVQSYREMIFDPQYPRSGEGDIPERRRRIKHFNWYRKNRDKVLSRIEPSTISKLLADPHKRWWLTGEDPPDSLHIPDTITAVRELEFFFTIWQTLFESAAFLLHETGKCTIHPIQTRHPLRDFLNLILLLPSDYRTIDCKKLAGVCLGLHETHIAPRLDRWQKDIRHLSGIQGFESYEKLHNEETIAEFGRQEGTDMLEALANLHVRYCELQNKPYAVCVYSFKEKRLGGKYPRFSAEFGQTRWGLFGYRFEAAITLFASQKYFEDEKK